MSTWGNWVVVPLVCLSNVEAMEKEAGLPVSMEEIFFSVKWK